MDALKVIQSRYETISEAIKAAGSATPTICFPRGDGSSYYRDYELVMKYEMIGEIKTAKDPIVQYKPYFVFEEV